MLALFDFIDWLDTQTTLDPGFDLEQIYGEWFGSLYTPYKALLIDYLLLCSLQAPKSAGCKGNEEKSVVCEICIDEIKRILQLTLKHENASFNISFVVHLRCSALT